MLEQNLMYVMRELQRDKGEDNIPIDYLKSCSDYHDKMLDKNTPYCVCNEQLILNGNSDIYKNEHILDEWIKSIEKFI